MELRHLRYYTAVVEAKGFREASRRLHVAQPALTQTVHDLESELGFKLLERSSRSFATTQPGEVFYHEAKRTLQQADQAVSAATRAATGVTDAIAIGFIPGATEHFLPELLRSFKTKHPHVRLDLRELTPTVQLDALLRGELDLALTRQIPDEQRVTLASRVLFRVPLIAVLPASRPVADGAVEIQSLANEHFVLLNRKESPALFDAVIELCQQAGFTPRISSHAHLAEAMFTLVKAGEGVSIVPMWASAFVKPGLQCVRLLPDTARAELVAAWKSASNSVALQQFLDCVEENKAQIQASPEYMAR